MRILLSNDDGAASPGLAALCRSVSELAEVYVFAPSVEQSATGHGITVKTPLRLHEYPLPGAVQAFAVDGLPADCIKLACECVMKEPPDLVISGINNGSNLATDVLYSGTVSAAVEGFLSGIPAMAVSLNEQNRNLDAACSFVREFVLWWEKNHFQPHCMFNINIPGGRINGARYVRLGKRTYNNTFEERIDPRGKPYYWLSGSPQDQGHEGSSDVEVIREDYITITPLTSDLTDFKILDTLKDRLPLT